jgi:Holliday junction DNA helicase RuvA
MFSYIKGEITSICSGYAVIENMDIGYKVFVDDNLASTLNLNEMVILFIYTNVREHDISLFGFLKEEYLNLFSMLISVSGIGSKSAISILSAIDYNSLMNLVMLEDISSLSNLPGIGKKTAARIVVELRDKFKNIYNPENIISPYAGVDYDERRQAKEALISLGYSKSESLKVIDAMDLGLSTEQLIKLALRKLN